MCTTCTWSAVADRSAFRSALDERGVGTAVHYPLPIHRQPAYTQLGRSGQLSVVDAASATIVSLPLHADLTDAEVAYVADAVSDVLQA